MSLFLLLSYVLRVRSAPLSSFFGAPIVLEDDITGVAATRTLWNIVYTCFTTTFAITWISMHPNIPKSNNSYFSVFLRLLLATYALLIPEAIVFWAAVQWKSAHEYTAYFAEEHPHWTLTHGFFLIMGGFTLPSEIREHKGYRVVPAHEFKLLVATDQIIFPTVEEEDLKDKSKGDPLAKGFVILQTLWFVIQILARFAQNLVVTELEVITFALVPLNIATYYFWMHKPLSVKRPILLERNLRAPAIDLEMRRATSPISLLSFHPDSAIGESPQKVALAEGKEQLNEPRVTNSPSVVSQKGRFEKWLGRFIKWVKFWTDEADEMMKTSHPSSPVQMTHADNLGTPHHLQTTEEPQKKGSKKITFKHIVTVVASVGAFTQRFVSLRRNSRKFSTSSDDSASSIAFMTKSIIGSMVAIIVVVFLTVFAILSISPLLFVALGFLCVAILTAPWVATRAFHAIGTEPNTNGKDPSLAIFYAPKMDKRSTNIVLTVTVIGATIFGGLHVLAWQFQFPTPTEHLLWRISSLTLTALPALYLGCHLLNDYVFVKESKIALIKKINGPIRAFIRHLVLLGIPAYTLARLFVLAEAVVALRDPRPGTLSAVTWSKFIPHF